MVSNEKPINQAPKTRMIVHQRQGQRFLPASTLRWKVQSRSNGTHLEDPRMTELELEELHRLAQHLPLHGYNLRNKYAVARNPSKIVIEAIRYIAQLQATVRMRMRKGTLPAGKFHKEKKPLLHQLKEHNRM